MVTRSGNLVLVGLVLAAASATYMVKFQADDARDRLAQLRRDIAAEREAIDILRADWSLLTNPARLQALAERHGEELRLTPVSAKQIVTLEALPARLEQVRPVAPLQPVRRAETVPDTDAISRLITGSIVEPERAGDGE